MWKQRAVTLCGGLAMLPLIIGCSHGVDGQPQADAAPSAYASAQAYPPPPIYSPTEAYAPSPGYSTLSPAIPTAADVGGAHIYTVGSGAPAAIVVVLPGVGDVMTANPRLWAAQGFDVVTPTHEQIYQLVANQERVMARLLSEAQALVNAPVWLMGSNSAVETAIGSLPPRGQVSRIVMTSTSSGERTCSEEMTYSYSGSGAPKVSVSKSGNACPPGPPFGAGSDTTLAPPAPAVRPHAPRIIEASLPASHGSPAAQRKAVQQIADLIKSPPS